MRGSETVRVAPTAEGDILDEPAEPAGASYDLEGCHVIPRVSSETGQGMVGIEGYDVYYFGTEPAPKHTATLEVRGDDHEIVGEPRDLIVKGRRKALIITTKGIS